MSGAAIMPLPQTLEIDVADISNFITKVLYQLNIQDAYGILAGVQDRGGPVVPTFIFGIPHSDNEIVQFILPPSPNNIPILLRDDSVLSTNELENAWAVGPIADLEKLTLEACSVGIESMQVLPQKPFTVLT